MCVWPPPSPNATDRNAPKSFAHFFLPPPLPTHSPPPLLCHPRAFTAQYFSAFSAVSLRLGRQRKRLAALVVTRRQRIQRTVLKLLLRRAEFRTFVRWKRRRTVKRIKWIAFRAWVDAIAVQRATVVRVQRAARTFLFRRRKKASAVIGFAVALWVARVRMRVRKQEAAER